VTWKIIKGGFKSVFWVAVILAPLLGVWTGSSLAAYLNGPIWLAVAVGGLLFPGIPLLLDWRSTRRFNRRNAEREKDYLPPKERILTFSDRLILRTLVLNAVFLTLLLGSFPQKGFEALTTRGDWMLDGYEGPVARAWRGHLFQAAEGLEWLYLLTADNPYTKHREQAPAVVPKPTQVGKVAVRVEQPKVEQPKVEQPKVEQPKVEQPKVEQPKVEQPKIEIPDVEPHDGSPSWPMPRTLHIAARSMPAANARWILGVADWLRRHESNPVMQVKALNDWVADNIVYDVPALRSMNIPPQDAASVFSRRIAVCAGYSNLMVALGRELGIEIVYVSGVSRGRDGQLSPGGHAWNAVKLDGGWYLMDTTWNAGYVDGDRFVKSYKTDYLFTPPRLFARNHLPDDGAWQLLENPISRGEFLRQANLKPGFFAHSLELIRPDRSQIEVRSAFEVSLRNPRSSALTARIAAVSGGESKRCSVQTFRDTTIRCELPTEPARSCVLWYFGEVPHVGRLPESDACARPGSRSSRR
jgi:transglutaminase-like putative cysteine protease